MHDMLETIKGGTIEIFTVILFLAFVFNTDENRVVKWGRKLTRRWPSA